MFGTEALTRGENLDADRDAEINVTHFIPSVQLKGTRTEKLEKLDLLIGHLECLRRSLTDQHRPAPPEWKPLQLTPSDRWWAAGLFAMAALVLVMLGVRGCATVEDDGLAVPPSHTARLLLATDSRVRFPRNFTVARECLTKS